MIFGFLTFFLRRYRGYYEPPYVVRNNTVVPNEHAYEFTSTHWHLLAAKLFFVITFEVFINHQEKLGDIRPIFMLAFESYFLTEHDF